MCSMPSYTVALACWNGFRLPLWGGRYVFVESQWDKFSNFISWYRLLSDTFYHS